MQIADDVIHTFKWGKEKYAKLVRKSSSCTLSKLVSEPQVREAAEGTVVSHRSLPKSLWKWNSSFLFASSEKEAARKRSLGRGGWEHTHILVCFFAGLFSPWLTKLHIQCRYEPTWVYMLPYIPECPSVKYRLCIQGWKIVWLLGQNIYIWFSKAFLLTRHIEIPISYLEKWYKGQKV